MAFRPSRSLGPLAGASNPAGRRLLTVTIERRHITCDQSTVSQFPPNGLPLQLNQSRQCVCLTRPRPFRSAPATRKEGQPESQMSNDAACSLVRGYSKSALQCFCLRSRA